MQSNYPNSNNGILIGGQKKWSLHCKLINHLDSVRRLYFCDDKNLCISVSEDYLVNIWDIKSIMFNENKSTTSLNNNICQNYTK